MGKPDLTHSASLSWMLTALKAALSFPKTKACSSAPTSCWIRILFFPWLNNQVTFLKVHCQTLEILKATIYIMQKTRAQIHKGSGLCLHRHILTFESSLKLKYGKQILTPYASNVRYRELKRQGLNQILGFNTVWHFMFALLFCEYVDTLCIHYWIFLIWFSLLTKAA